MTSGKKLLNISFVLLPILLVLLLSLIQAEKLLNETPRSMVTVYILLTIPAIALLWQLIKQSIERKGKHIHLSNDMELPAYAQVLRRDLDDKILSWNEGMERLYGWTKQEVIGKESHQLFSTVFTEPLTEIKKQLLTNDHWQGELKHIRKDGTVVFVSSFWSLIRNNRGYPSSIVETNNDITELKKAKQKISSLSREINLSKDAIYTVDIDLVLTSWNKGAEHLYGFTDEEAIGRRINELLKTGASTEDFNFMIRKLKDTNHWSGELKRKTKYGCELYVYTSAHSIRESDGTLTGYVCVSIDITERLQLSEQVCYLATLVEQSSDAIVSVALDGKILTWNSGAATLYGYTADEAIGKNISMIIPGDLAEEQTANMAFVLQGKPIHQFETQRIRKDGRRVFTSLTFSPVRNGHGTLTAVAGIARDISERKNAEQKIAQSEENLKAVFEHASEGFVLTDREGIIKESNKRAQQSILVNSEEKIIPGKSIFDFVTPNRIAFFKNILENVLDGKTIQYDRSFERNGHITWMAFTYNPVRKDKTITGVCIAGLDITEKKLAEQQKEFDRNNLHALINTTSDLMWSVSRDFKLITSNQAFDEMVCRITGKKVINGDSVLDWVINDSMRARYKEYYERAFAGEAFTEIEYTVTSREYWAENSFYPIYEGSAVIGTACFSRDISKQKIAEQQLQYSFNEKWSLAERMAAILNTLPANIALLNDKGLIVDVNSSWKDFTSLKGYQGSRYGIGQNYLTIAEKSSCDAESDGKLIAAGIRSVIENSSSEFVFEYPYYSATEHRWFRMVATPLKDKEYAGAVVMHIDISKLKQLEQERLAGKMNEQKKLTRIMLQAQEKERNELGRELHDNICQILAAIKMKLNFCADNQSLSFPIIKEAVGYLEEAVNETRNLSHRMLMPRFAESSLSDALESLVATYAHHKRSTTLESRRDEEKNIPATVKETLYRIAQEQLHNIDKYAKASEVILHINFHPDLITMCIEDNGIGFDPQKKRTGVGLANIRNRTESFHGSLNIISAEGEGCTLLVKIPLREK